MIYAALNSPLSKSDDLSAVSLPPRPPICHPSIRESRPIDPSDGAGANPAGTVRNAFSFDGRRGELLADAIALIGDTASLRAHVCGVSGVLRLPSADTFVAHSELCLVCSESRIGCRESVIVIYQMVESSFRFMVYGQVMISGNGGQLMNSCVMESKNEVYIRLTHAKSTYGIL